MIREIIVNLSQLKFCHLRVLYSIRTRPLDLNIPVFFTIVRFTMEPIGQFG